MTAYRSRAVLPAGLMAGMFLLVAAVPNPAFADQIVYFVNGKAMMVKSVEKGSKFSVLEVEGGGKIGIPNEQIDRIEEYQVQPSGAGIPQTVPAPAPGIPVAQGQLLPGAQPPAVISGRPPMPLPSGPGFGGRTDFNPQANIGGLNPIALGGDSPAQGPSRPQPGTAMQMGGPGGVGGGRMMNPGGPGRPGFPQRAMAGRPPGRGGMGQRRIPDMTGYQASPQVQPQQPAQNAQPAATPAPTPPPEQEEAVETTPEPPPAAAPPDDGAPSGDGGPADQGSS